MLPRFFASTTAAVALTLGLAISQTFAAAPTSQPSSDSNTQLKQEVEDLQQKVADLEAREADTAAVDKAIIADSDKHSELFMTSINTESGYNPSVGFVLQSEDGQFTFHPGVLLDFRYMASYREKTPANGEGEVAQPGYTIQDGFDVTRARLIFSGNFTSAINYYVQFQDDQGTAFNLFDVWWVYHLPNNSPFSVKVGQFKDPVWRERLVSEATLMAVDRSMVEFLLGGGQGSRVQGVSLMYDQGLVRSQLAFHDGFNSINTKFFNSGGVAGGVGGESGVTPDDFGVSSRGEFLVLGRRSDQFDPYRHYDSGFTALGNNQENYLIIGGAFDFTQAGVNDLIAHTADIQFNSPSGLSFFGAYYGTYRDIKTNQGVNPGFYYDPGFLVQASWLLDKKIEPFARYDYTYIPLGSTTGLNTGEVQEITVGANYYLYKQNAKFTVDAVWLPDGSPADSDALGILKDSGHNEFVLRCQFQLAL
jgi:hypothetical protein